MAWRVQDVLDVRSGLWAAAIMASLVAAINFDHGVGPASIAAAKQAVYTFFFGGAVVRLCTRLAERPGPAWLAIGLAVAIPWMATTLATLAVHSARGTPRPFASTLPVALLTPPALILWARRTRKSGVSTATPEPAAEGERSFA